MLHNSTWWWLNIKQVNRWLLHFYQTQESQPLTTLSTSSAFAISGQLNAVSFCWLVGVKLLIGFEELLSWLGITEHLGNFLSFESCSAVQHHSAVFCFAAKCSVFQYKKRGFESQTLRGGYLAWRNVECDERGERDCLQLFVDNGGIWISNVNQQNHFGIFYL